MQGYKFECELMSWSRFSELSEIVAEKINASGYKPDFMVGLARGGWVLSRVLCDYLGVKDLVSLKVEHWGVTATPDGKASIKYAFDIDLTGKKGLVVDDITDTGESLTVALDYVGKKNPAEVKTAALLHIEGSKFTPDFYGEEIKWRWVVFPWNVVEDLCNIIPKLATDDPHEIKLRLLRDHNIELPLARVKEIQAEILRRNDSDT